MVEDDEGVRAAVVDMLTDLGYQVLRAENAEAALKLLEGGAQLDLLFTDVVMPGAISTREFTRRAQADASRDPDPLHLRLYPERHRP